MKLHLHRGASGQHVAGHGTQQVGRSASVALIGGDGKRPGNPLIAVGIVGCEGRGALCLVVPHQPRGREEEAVVGHQPVGGIVTRRERDRHADAVPFGKVHTIDPRNGGSDTDIGFTVGRVAAPGDKNSGGRT